MKKTKVDIISGFLGAGKTTFIMKLMEDLYQKETVVILENEFGKINIDQETLGREGFTVKPIQANCICCTGAGDLAKGVREIIEEYAPDRIIIEPTGIAKLSDVKKTMVSKDMKELCDIDHVVTIVDARNYHIRIMVSKDFFENQLRSSEVIFLSKTEGMEPESIDHIEAEIRNLQAHGLIVREEWDDIAAVQLQNLMDYKRDSSAGRSLLRMVTYHENDFESYEIITDQSIAVKELRDFIKEVEEHSYGEIHRVKGIFCDPECHWYSVEYVPGEMNLVAISGDKISDQGTKLCVIGRELQREKLDTVFKQ